MIYKKTEKCRFCQSSSLIKILDLGNQFLTGIFPKPEETIDSGPLELVKCDSCHLVQMAHSYDLSKLYGNTYGYRSGLNKSMVAHLGQKVAHICKVVNLVAGDVVLDIGANDGTLLGSYENRD
jgi:hypothetical protein